MFLLEDYNYELPEELIAQEPVKKRDESRLMAINKNSGDISNRYFYELCDLLPKHSVLVINNTKVIPGRLVGKKESSGKVELLILDYVNIKKDVQGDFICKCIIKSSKRPKINSHIFFDNNLNCKILDFNEGIYTVKFTGCSDFEAALYAIGNIPLPPYIKRKDKNKNDKDSYQTIYASQKGAIAAPTAGLHFSDALLNDIKSKGIKIIAITLHVGYGTFLPVRSSDIREHKIHSEWYYISKESTEEINLAKDQGKQIIAVGTTSVRTLEYLSDEKGKIKSGYGFCDLFIYPGYKFKIVDALITNFHLPKSTLLMLVSAFAGYKTILSAYREAIEKKYRFYSYGDAMFIV
ncbi:MAG: tRNA preQ1(34) S-adenosylmethionine ribosyltransferase-isomerase QueA [Desulfobacterales bacterium]|nr:tRNA preQ1(34) S-adenosylmethionine ribosyltransferase-isomerase QueA [Desulfobacterales bacterium]MBF0399103.1 tRNA preQ1(34) S-adenosylmethionine ribosyltransferase-isomerase QueA [Desulfobacterales bacterium]